MKKGYCIIEQYYASKSVVLQDINRAVVQMLAPTVILLL